MYRLLRSAIFLLISICLGIHATAQVKNTSYANFKQMADEDAKLREILDKVADSTALAGANRRIAYTDSIHFDHLHHYVQEKGWPLHEDGAEYAIKLAVHDHEHYSEYQSALKKAAIKDSSYKNDLELINDLVKAERQYQNFKKKILVRKKYMRFEVSSMLQNSLPASLPRIAKLVKEHCKSRIGMFYVIECRYERTANLWADQAGVNMKHSSHNDILTQLNKKIQDVCPGNFYEGCCWAIQYVPAEHKHTKLILYVMWDYKSDGEE